MPAGLTALDTLLAPNRLVDLTQEHGPGTVLWPGSTPFAATIEATHERDGAYLRTLTIPEHFGTHFDAPAHFAPGGATVESIPIGRLVREAAVVDAAGDVGDDPDHAVPAATLIAWEATHGPIPPGSIVVVRTGWDRFRRDARRYVGADGPRLPGLRPDAAELLVSRGVVGVGIDSLGIDRGLETEAPVHRILLSAGLWAVEGLVGLERLPPRGAWIVVAPIRLVAGSGSPARVFAILPA